MYLAKRAVYRVRFKSSLGAVGSGVLSVCGSRLTGFDGGYHYRGIVHRIGGLVRGVVVVQRAVSNAVSVFGPVERFVLDISGNCVAGNWTYSGQVQGAGHLRLRFDLVELKSKAA